MVFQDLGLHDTRKHKRILEPLFLLSQTVSKGTGRNSGVSFTPKQIMGFYLSENRKLGDYKCWLSVFFTAEASQILTSNQRLPESFLVPLPLLGNWFFHLYQELNSENLSSHKIILHASAFKPWNVTCSCPNLALLSLSIAQHPLAILHHFILHPWSYLNLKNWGPDKLLINFISLNNQSCLSERWAGCAGFGVLYQLWHSFIPSHGHKVLSVHDIHKA